uniref:Uncharacterized protein n=1 Tax=Ciona intestinalis TaxID=7719 RepID=H2XUB5_CIOIN
FLPDVDFFLFSRSEDIVLHGCSFSSSDAFRLFRLPFRQDSLSSLLSDSTLHSGSEETVLQDSTFPLSVVFRLPFRQGSSSFSLSSDSFVHSGSEKAVLQDSFSSSLSRDSSLHLGSEDTVLQGSSFSPSVVVLFCGLLFRLPFRHGPSSSSSPSESSLHSGSENTVLQGSSSSSHSGSENTVLH